MEIPARLVIGPYRYRVTVDPRELLSRGHEDGTARGEADGDRKIIRVDPTFPEENPITLLHETLHAIGDVAGWRDPEEKVDQETAIRRFAPLLVDTLRRNPQLVYYLTDLVPREEQRQGAW